MWRPLLSSGDIKTLRFLCLLNDNLRYDAFDNRNDGYDYNREDSYRMIGSVMYAGGYNNYDVIDSRSDRVGINKITIDIKRMLTLFRLSTLKA